MKTTRPTIRQIARVLGLFEFCRPAVWFAPLYVLSSSTGGANKSFAHLFKLRHSSKSILARKRKSVVVSSQSTTAKGETHPPTNSRSSDLIGRLQVGMGGGGVGLGETTSGQAAGGGKQKPRITSIPWNFGQLILPSNPFF